MTNRAVAIIGDIHGEAGKLRTLIDTIRARFGDVDIYAVGDFIDRGPDPKGVIQIAIDEGIQGVLGNHELWLHKYLATGIFGPEALHFMMGGHSTLGSYGLHYKDTQIDRITQGLRRAIPEEHRAFILGLPLTLTIEVAGVTYWITHAGVKGGMARMFLEQAQDTLSRNGVEAEFTDTDLVEIICTLQPDSLLWDHFDEEQPDLYRFRNGEVQVFGHKAVREPIDAGHFLAIDTGCGRKQGRPGRPNRLTAVVLKPQGGREFVSVA